MLCNSLDFSNKFWLNWHCGSTAFSDRDVLFWLSGYVDAGKKVPLRQF